MNHIKWYKEWKNENNSSLLWRLEVALNPGHHTYWLGNYSGRLASWCTRKDLSTPEERYRCATPSEGSEGVAFPLGWWRHLHSNKPQLVIYIWPSDKTYVFQGSRVFPHRNCKTAFKNGIMHVKAKRNKGYSENLLNIHLTKETCLL